MHTTFHDPSGSSFRQGDDSSSPPFLRAVVDQKSPGTIGLRVYVGIIASFSCHCFCSLINITLQTSYNIVRFFMLNCFIFFFFLSGFSFTTIHESRNCRAEEGGGHFFNSSLPLSPASQTVRNQAGDYCRELNCAYRLQPDSNRKPLVTKHKSLTTKLHDNIVSRKFTDTFSQNMEKFLKT